MILALGHSARDTFTMLQRELDARAFELGGGTYEAPAQLVGDFLAGRPAGEGAGYAGGILSAGVDGIRVAEAVTREMLRGGAVKV